MRHTTATLLKNLGVPARDVQLILGHSNIMTTQQIYQHDDMSTRRDALTRLQESFGLDGNADPVKESALPSKLPSHVISGLDKDERRRPMDAFFSINSWLERRGVVQTFDDADPLKLERDIYEIRELLNEPDENKESSEC